MNQTSNAPPDPALKPAAPPQPLFSCHICAEPSTEICVYCTKDCCELHRCEKCLRCTDCCLCHLDAIRRA